MADEQTLPEADAEDVEAHRFADAPADGAPSDGLADDKDAAADVEAHIFDRPADGMADGAPADG